MAELPLIPFVAGTATDPEHRFVFDEAALQAVLDEATAWAETAPPAEQHDDFAEAQRLLAELAAGPPPVFIADPSDEYLKAIEDVETCLRQRRAAG